MSFVVPFSDLDPSTKTRSFVSSGQDLDEVDGRPPHPLLVADATERLAMLGATGPAFGTWPDLDDAVEDLGAVIGRKGGEAPRRRLETGRHR